TKLLSNQIRRKSDKPATHLWTELDLISTTALSGGINSAMLTERNRNCCFQFLMRLRPEFEQVRSRLIAEDKTDINTVLDELIPAETRFITQAQLDALTTLGMAFATNRYRPQFQNKSSLHASSGTQVVSPSSSTWTCPVKCNFC
ncbi:hypothetical protein LINGRAHAP2_LOCUS5225, partial [Linum grandiflorum]